MGSPAATVSVLLRLLEAAGYRLDDQPDAVSAVRARDRRAVLIVGTHRSPIELDALFPTDAAHRTIVYPDEPGSVARGLASERGIELLDPSTLGSALGELLLPGPELNVPEEPGAPSLPLAAPPLLFPDGERTVRPRLTRTDAEALAGVEGFRSTLRLIPFFIAAYRVRVPTAHGGHRPASDHLVAVNALSGRAEFWEPGERELIADLDEPHQRLEPQLGEEHVRAIAVDSVRRRHVVSVDHTEQHGGALVIERRRAPPSPDDLALAPAVLVHVPYWYIEGADGRVVLDAVTGARTVPSDPEPDPVR